MGHASSVDCGDIRLSEPSSGRTKREQLYPCALDPSSGRANVAQTRKDDNAAHHKDGRGVCGAQRTRHGAGLAGAGWRGIAQPPVAPAPVARASIPRWGTAGMRRAAVPARAAPYVVLVR
jgi:hypothetical protein